MSSLPYAVALATGLTLATTAGFAATVVSYGGGALGASPAPVDIDPGDLLVMSGSIDDGEITSNYTFTATSALRVKGVSVSVSGAESDISVLSLVISNGAAGDSSFAFTPNAFQPTTGTGDAFFDKFSMAAGQTVTVTVTEPNDGSLSASLPVTLFAATAVPVPAALPLMMGALGGIAALRLRRK